MKKIILLLSVLFSLASHAQTIGGNLFNFVPFMNSRVHTSDSVQIQFVLVTSDTVSPSISITQTAGTPVSFTPKPLWIEGSMMVSPFWLQGLAPGTYTFTGTAKSGNGMATGTQSYTLTVVPDPPTPTVTSVTFLLYGVPVTIPSGQSTKIDFSNGSAQTY